MTVVILWNWFSNPSFFLNTHLRCFVILCVLVGNDTEDRQTDEGDREGGDTDRQVETGKG